MASVSGVRGKTSASNVWRGNLRIGTVIKDTLQIGVPKDGPGVKDLAAADNLELPNESCVPNKKSNTVDA